MDCLPICTRPMTGTSVPKNQNQPVSRYRRRRPNTTMSTEMNARANPDDSSGASPQFAG